MPRQLPILAAVAAACGLTGCAGTWDTLTSRKFREKPIATMFPSDDPLTVMRTSREGDERAKAMRRLKEPARNGRSEAEQDEAVQLLSAAATADPSPVVRVAAIDALGRFHDPRAVEALTAAYHQAGGTPRATGATDSGVRLTAARAGADEAAVLAERFSLSGPAGFPPDVSGVIRSRAVAALAETGRQEAVPLLTQVATGAGDDGAADRDTRLAAVRGLTRARTTDSVAALSRVLTAEKGKDPALAGRAYQGLKDLTGQMHPSDPAAWEAVVRGRNFEVQPAPNAIQQAAAWAFDDD